MNILLGLTDNKDIILIQALQLLESRSVSIDEVHYIRTSGKEIQTEVQKYYESKNVKIFTSEMPNHGKLQNENDYLN